jgi:hypothetical protein
VKHYVLSDVVAQLVFGSIFKRSPPPRRLHKKYRNKTVAEEDLLMAICAKIM